MLKPVAWANSLAATTVLFTLVSWVLANVAPSLFATLFNAQFLGADIASKVPTGWNMQTALVTVVSAGILSWVVGYVWAVLYNKLQK